jgi:hypothetical protein
MRKDKNLPDGYVRTAWKSEIYPLSAGKDGKPARLADVVRGVHLMFKARRIAWNTCIAAIRKSDAEDRERYKNTGEKTKSICFNSTKLGQIGVSQNPWFPNNFKAWVIEFLSSKPKPGCSTVKSPMRGAFALPIILTKRHPLHGVYGVRGWWSIAGTIKKGQPNRHCVNDVITGSIPNAYNRWIDQRHERKTNKALMAKAIKWAKNKKGRHAWQYGRPKFHRRENCNSTYLCNDAIVVKKDRLFIGGVPGSFKIAHPFPWATTDDKLVIAGGNLSERAGRFFASFSLQVPAAWLAIARSP